MELVVKVNFENYKAGDVITDADEVQRLKDSPFTTKRARAPQPIPQRVVAPIIPAPVVPAATE